MASQLVNSAGSLVSSILESAGYHYQSAILDALSEPLKNEIGGLVYLVGICIALFQIAILKSSKLAPWLLIGPAIFLFVINERDDIQNAQWQFGSHKRVQSEVDKGVNSITNGSTARVSKVFKRYIEMIGASVSAIVDTISNVQVENDLWMLSKGQLFGNMTTLQEDDVGLKQLIHYGLLNKCHHVISIARSVSDPTKRTVQSNAAKGQVDEAQRYFSPSQLQAEEDFQKLAHRRDISFAQIHPVLDYIARLEGHSGESIHARKRQLVDQTFSCIDIWEFALQAIIKKAERFEDSLAKDSARIGIKPEAMKNLLLQASGQGSASSLLSNGTYSSEAAQELARVIAKYYLRNETRNTDMGSRIASFVGRNDIRKVGVGFSGSNAYTEQARVAAQEWAEKERLTYAAHSMPTYQGLALYFLAIAFPFFALLLLIPGRATGFLLWFLLWLWIKSWDIALAIVAQLDTIFWSIYVVQKQSFGADDKIPTEFKAAFSALEQTDPTFQMTGYYAMLAVCILAIPAVTAQFVMGGMKGGASILSQGMQKMSDFFSDGALIRTEQGVINQLKSDATELKSLRGLAYAYGGQLEKRVLEGREPSRLYQTGAQVPAPGSEQKVSLMGAGNMRSPVQYALTNVDGNVIKQNISASNALSGNVAYAESLYQPHRPLGGAGGGQVGSSLLQAKTLIERSYGKALSEQELQKQEADLKALISHSAFEADMERKVHDLHERMAVFRAIPVPWSELGEEGSAKEFERHVQRFQEKTAVLKSFVNAAQEGVQAVGGLAADAEGTSGYGWLQSGAILGGGKMIMDSLSPQLKQNMIDMYDIKGETKEEKEKNLEFYLEENLDDRTLLLLQSDLSSLKNGAAPFNAFRDTRNIDDETLYEHRRNKRRKE